MNIYFIGGSPCSGKSTVTEILSKKYDLYYFKVDDFLFAKEVRRQCGQEQYMSIVNDGSIEVDKMVEMVASNFGLVN